MSSVSQCSEMKKALRTQLRTVLNNMTIDDRKKQSKILTQKLLRHERYKSSERISIFLGLKHEVDTSEILADIFASNKLCFVPCYDPKSRFMQMLQLKSLDEIKTLPTTAWNIKQPNLNNDGHDALNSGGLDLIIAPGLGFTQLGQRLGSGKGYYDNYFHRYLRLEKECELKMDRSQIDGEGEELSPRKFYSIGLAFHQQMLTFVPSESHDFSLHEVISVNPLELEN